MKKLLINASFSALKNGIALGTDKLVSFALILEVEADFKGDLKPLVHEKLKEMNQEICSPTHEGYYVLNFTAQSF